MAIASGLLVVIVSGAFAVLLLAIEDMRKSARQATHSQTELTTSGRLEALVLDLETGQRGFVITRKERFLAPWKAARRAFPAQERRLRRLIDDPEQARLERRIAAAITSYIREYSIPLVNAARRGSASARGVAATAAGKRRVDELRAMFDRFVAAERAFAIRRQQGADSDARRAVIAAIAGLTGSIVLIVLFAGYLTRAIVLPVRRAALMAGRLAGGNLAVRMPETGAGEIADLERAFNTMGGSLEASRDELRLLVAEQAALRRVATLVARGGSPGEVFAAVATEVGRLLGADSATLLRFLPDGTATVVAGPSEAGMEVRVGKRLALEAEDVAARVLRTGRAARVDNFEGASGSVAALLREAQVGTAVGAPVVVEGRLWGVMIAGWLEAHRLPPQTEGRMAQFTELLATAIANADSRAELNASRARVVTAADEMRRRIERDLHDGTQQRLVSLGLELRAAEAMAPPELTELKAKLSETADGLADALEDLQEIARGIHPAILSRGGLGPAVRALARRSPVPVEVEVSTGPERLPPPVEVAAYYVVSEALTNAAKHAKASVVHVGVQADEATLEVCVRDDGVGGADLGRGSGLIGLRDRVEALGGEIEIASRPRSGTSLHATMPIERGSSRA